MATSNTNTTRNFLRQIVFDNLFTTEEKKTNFVLNSGVTECTIGTVKCSATLYEIVYANEMYSPSHLTVKFNIVSGENLPAYQDIVKFFLLAKVTIKRPIQTAGTTGITETLEPIDSNYYVHEVRPTYVNTGTKDNLEKKIVVYLDIFSADKLLTLDKYSKSYVNKSLYGDIIEPEAKTLLKDAKIGGITVSTQDLSSRLKYGENSSSEIKHPYLVQYNESFYDFLIRTANRTGEFLYFTDGQLTLGVKADAVVTTVDNYNSLAVESRNNSVLTTVGISRNYGIETHEKSSDKLRYTQPTANDDYLVRYKKDGFDSFTLEYNQGYGFIVAAFKALLTTPSLGAFAKTILVDNVGFDMLKASSQASRANDRYNKIAIEKAPGKVDDSKSVFSGTYREDSEFINDWYVNANADFYNKIDECEKLMGSRTITLTLKGDDATNYKVGQLIEVEGSKYVVTHVKYCEVYDGITMRQEYVIKALPLLIVNVNAGTHKATLMLTDEKGSSTDQTLSICCPVALPEEKRLRKASSQTAWVVESDDPKYQGRARIRYAWDKDGVGSPWIRQTEPAAGKGGGTYFRLYKDDEVMIGYENDNIEQPYIIGALYHGKDDDLTNGAPVGRNKAKQATHVIRNKSGHQMVFSEKSDNFAFIAGTQPGFNFLFPYLPKDFQDCLPDPKEGSVLAGGIQFSDKFGIYNVTMSSDQRQISIASPLGNIKLNAFTGISISAPRGDISISGKNVTIKAANKLTMQSGENAKPAAKQGNFGSKILQETAEGTIDFVASLADLSLLRHIFEVFLQPVDGTMQIKSHRYLLLEAGEGSAMIPEQGFQDAEINDANKDKQGSFEKYYGRSNKTIIIKNHLKALTDLISGEFNSYEELLDKLGNDQKAYIDAYDLTAEPELLKVNDLYTGLLGHLNSSTFYFKWMLEHEYENRPYRATWQPAKDAASALHGTMRKLKKSLDKGFSNKWRHWASTGWWLDTEFGKALAIAEKKYRTLTANLYVMPQSIQDIGTCKNKFAEIKGNKIFAEVVFAYLESLRDNCPVSILDESKGKTTRAPESRADWDIFLGKLDYHKPKGLNWENFAGNLIADNFEKMFLKSTTIFESFKEKKMWGKDRAKFGRVLFSDQGKKTYYIKEDGTIENPENPGIGAVVDAVKAAISADYPQN